MLNSNHIYLSTINGNMQIIKVLFCTDPPIGKAILRAEIRGRPQDMFKSRTDHTYHVQIYKVYDGRLVPQYTTELEVPLSKEYFYKDFTARQDELLKLMK